MSIVEFFGAIGIVLVVVLVIFAMVGYISNIVQLYHYDFETPLKAEAIRVAGIFFPPAGMIMGYCDIDDGEVVK